MPNALFDIEPLPHHRDGAAHGAVLAMRTSKCNCRLLTGAGHAPACGGLLPHPSVQAAQPHVVVQRTPASTTKHHQRGAPHHPCSTSPGRWAIGLSAHAAPRPGFQVQRVQVAGALATGNAAPKHEHSVTQGVVHPQGASSGWVGRRASGGLAGGGQ